MKKIMGGLEKPHEIKVLKKERAIIKTLLSYK
jgi:ribosomal protein L29